jgi:hypothetical protein
MQFQVECPSGAVFEFKEMGGRQLIAVAERVGATASGETLVTILSSCCTSIIDAGPYPELVVGKGSPNWANMLYGDVITALLWLRIKSFPDIGGEYDYTFFCEHCGTKGRAGHDLLELLEDPEANRRLSEEASRALLARQPLTATIPARHAPPVEGSTEAPPIISEAISVSFDLHRIAQDVVMREKMKTNNRKKITTVEQVAAQLKGVQGFVTQKTGEPVRDLVSLWRWVQDQSVDTIDNLLAQMRAADCGVDPVITVRCNGEDGCAKQMEISLPFGKSFFSPRSGATKKASTTNPAS